MARLTEYLKSLIKADTLDSSKSFALVASVAVGVAVGLCVCFCLVWDVCSNGYVKTDLDGMGVFLLCVGGFMAGGGLNKAASEWGKAGRTMRTGRTGADRPDRANKADGAGGCE